MTLSAAERIEMVDWCLSGEGRGVASLVETLAADAHRSLAGFTAQLWHVLEPGKPLEWRWYHDLICRELEMVTAGTTRDLVICVPPGTMKSMLGSVFWPSWEWLRKPDKRLLALSSSDGIATRDSWKMRMVITSEWYRKLVAVLAERGMVPAWELTRDQNQKVNFVNTALGARQCFSTGGAIMGHRGDGYLVDDPHQLTDVLGSPEQVMSALEKAHEKVDVVLPSRVNDQRTAWRVLIQQRVHEDDCAGRALKRDGTRKVVLPMHAFDEGHPWRHPDDPRAPGELLDPVRMPEEEVAKLAARLDTVPGQAQAQLEQQPVPPTGGLFKRAWMNNRYDFDPQRPPKRFDEIVVTVDATFKKTKKGAYNSIQAWGRYGWTQYYLLDEIHERLGYVELRQRLRGFAAKWRPAAILVELKANGEAIVDELRAEVPGVVGFMPDAYGDKIARAQLSTPMWASGGVWLPSAEAAPFDIGGWCTEVASFPGSLSMDRVDAKSQLFLWWQERRGSGGTRAVNAALGGLLRRR